MPKFKDEEKAKAFIEAQNQYRACARECAAVQKELRAKMYEMKVRFLTAQELETVKAETKLYKAVGRMFLLSTRTSIRADLSDAEQQTKKDLNALELKLKAFETKQNTIELKMRDIIEHHAILV